MMSLLALLMVSCSPCEDRIELTYTLECSESLLEYATPQVVYKNKDGNTVTIQINDNDWKNSQTSITSTTTIKVGDEEIKSFSNTAVKKWEMNVTYEKETSANEEMTVTYIPKSNIPSDATVIGGFHHNLNLKYFIKHDNSEQIGNGVNKKSEINIGKTLEEVIKSYRDEVSISINGGSVATYQKLSSLAP